MPSLIPYFESVVRILGELPEGTAEVLAGPDVQLRGNIEIGELRCSLRYSDGSTLHVELWADCSDDELGIQWREYGFHYLDNRSQLRFRYDNAPHYPDLATFPHHLHVGDSILAEGPPAIRDVARRIRRFLGSTT